MAECSLSRRDFLKLAGLTFVGTSASAVGSITYARKVEPEWVDVVNMPVKLPRLGGNFKGFRIVQISDIHLGTRWMTAERLSSCVELVNSLQADVIAITGDIISNWYLRMMYNNAPLLSGLQAREGVLAVLGNHDHWTDARIARRIMVENGIRDLSNAAFPIRRGDQTLYFAGVDDLWAEQADLGTVLEQTQGNEAAILLAHEPDFADQSAACGRFDMQISGHSHGGQVVIPGIGAPILPYMAKKYPQGLYQVGNMLQYTNRGLGMVPPYVRFNCRPEITVFSLEPKSQVGE